MPRSFVAFADLPDNERQIGRRVRAVRTQVRLSQAKLAAALGLTRDQLASVELGRVALRFAPGWRICDELNLNPLWLAFEQGDAFGFVDFSGSDEIFGNVLFSEIMLEIYQDDWFGGGYAKFREQELASARAKWQPSSKESRLARWMSIIKPEQQPDFWKTIEKSARDFVHGYQDNVKCQLTLRPAAARVGSMKLQRASFWPKLRERVRKLVRQRGMKSALARDIGVSRQAINALLSGSRKKPYVPSAEYALRLLEWSKAAEAKQKKERQSGGTTTGAKGTQTRKSNETRSSGPKKK